MAFFGRNWPSLVQPLHWFAVYRTMKLIFIEKFSSRKDISEQTLKQITKLKTHRGSKKTYISTNAILHNTTF